MPFALFLLGLTLLMMAVARPAAEVEIPISQSTIVLAIDVSRSMCATDVAPNRLTVAQEAALGFIADQEAGTQIGIVAFADFAEIIVPPTADKERLIEAISGLTTAFGTAIGSATLKGIDAIAEINPAVEYSGVNLRTGLDNPEDFQLPEGEYQPEIIVVLTDGANSNGPLPLAAAQQAMDRGIRVYTIGFGTQDPGEMQCSAAQTGSFEPRFGGGGFGGGGFGGGGNFRRFLVIDEPTLRGMAEMTGGEYFQAQNAEQLIEVFKDLPSRIVLQTEARELSVVFVALGAFLTAVAMGLSLLWNRFP